MAFHFIWTLSHVPWVSGLCLQWYICVQLCNNKSPKQHFSDQYRSQNIFKFVTLGYDELTCHCGAEIVYPPIPCGTRPPACSRPCARIHPCGHPVNHDCHSDEVCPPCTFLMEKLCVGEHEVWTLYFN